MRNRAAFVPLAALLVACAGSPQRPAEQTGPPAPAQGVRGRLTHRGRPLAGAVVYAYRRAGANLMGPADFASEPSGRDGSYLIDLAESSYHLVARRRASGGDAGPLLPGDLQGFFAGNPVTVLPDRFAVADLELGEVRELMPSRAPGRAAAGTGIRGRSVDETGRPVAWVFAIAYATPDMRRVPDFTSAMTAEDGRYEIRLPRGGRYYVGARARLRERPAPGEPFGLYDGSPDHGVEVPERGAAEGVDIVLRGFRGGGE